MAIEHTPACAKPKCETSDLDDSPVTADHCPPPQGKPTAPSALKCVIDILEGAFTVATTVAGSVERRDHRSSNPANWTTEQWIEAIKENPGKYGKLFAEMSAAGTLREGVDEDGKLSQFVGIAMQEFNRRITLLHDVLQAHHETLKTAASFRV